jgi:hypothetical protein
VITTCAPATAAPDLSITVPLIDAVFCAEAASGIISSSASTASQFPNRSVKNVFTELRCLSTMRPPNHTSFG